MISPMANAASVFLVLSLWLAVIIGPQMRMWPWAPSLIALAAALICACTTALRAKRPLLGPGTLVLGLITTAWISWRAWHSPVPELAQADVLLLASAVGGFLVARSIGHHRQAEALFLWGLFGLLVASVVMIVAQTGDPDFSQFRRRAVLAPSGFYSQYNEGANFLIGAGFLLMGGALLGKQHPAVKIIWLLAAILGVSAVWFTRSRGAVLGVVVGFVALAIFLLVIGSRRKAPWFAPAAIAFPIVLLASGFALYFGWEKVQRMRSDGKQGVVEMMDNTSRLRNYSLSYDAIMLNPVSGGGSRSYSWNSLQLWNPREHGLASHLPEQTHNEVLQAATDYGLIGVACILALIGWISIRGLWHSRFDEGPPTQRHASADALRLGGISALAGMMVQSSFSFVFHLLPGAMLLGIALGRLATPATLARTDNGQRTQPRILRISTALLALLIAIGILPAGFKGTRVLAELMPIYFKLGENPDEDGRIERFTSAIDTWPQSELHHLRAMIHHQRAVDGSEIVDPSSLQLALDDYLAASKHHPKFPGHFVNAANLYSLSGDFTKAEALYEQAIELQGTMEPAFRAHSNKAEHFRRKGFHLYRQGNPAASVRAMKSALESFQAAETKSAWLTGDAREQRYAIRLGLAAAQEAAGDHKGARDTLDALIHMPGGYRYRYYIGMLEYRNAMRIWQQRRPEVAARHFLNARNQLTGSRNHRPHGISLEAIQQQIDLIDEHLKLLREAGFGMD